ncbi:MAG: hypothetical protein FJW37_01105 [Acidobacteria bacterium]|nr:hypothetical protein [Acidobacteriota bacterium]
MSEEGDRGGAASAAVSRVFLKSAAVLVVGAWLGSSWFMAWVATQNFRSVDRLLEAPRSAEAAREVETMGRDRARAFLRHQVSEQNRWYFSRWESLQLPLAIGVYVLALFAARRDRWAVLAAGLMLVIVMAQKLFLTPAIVTLGRAIDFLPPAAASLERAQFWRYHGAYSAAEVSKWAAGLLLAGRLILVGRRGSGGAKLDRVDKADHRHIDR